MLLEGPIVGQDWVKVVEQNMIKSESFIVFMLLYYDT